MCQAAKQRYCWYRGLVVIILELSHAAACLVVLFDKHDPTKVSFAFYPEKHHSMSDCHPGCNVNLKVSFTS